jgi:uncharacterized protein YndB with AHSA1/START domain
MSTFSTRRQLAAPPSAVFAAFADGACLARWWGPDGFTNEFDLFEFRTGGRWVFTMIGPDGQRYANESVFDSVVPGQELVIRHVCQPLFTLTIRLAPADGGTLLTWDQAFADAEVAKAVAHIVEPANEQNLNRLVVALGARA